VTVELVFGPGITQSDEQVDRLDVHLCRCSFHCQP
jgi:hypothetical protein